MSETSIKINTGSQETPGAQAWAERGMNGKVKYGLHVTGDNAQDALEKLFAGWITLNKKFNDGLKAFNDQEQKT